MWRIASPNGKINAMDLARIEQHYNSTYAALDFERRGLFRLLQRQFKPREVVYLGSSIHVTPSFYFPHVRYVDNSAQSRDFFADFDTLKAFVSQRKQYRQAPYLQYIQVDYHSWVPSPFERGDLVLALYAPGALAATTTFMKRCGVLVYLPLPSDQDSAPPPGLAQMGIIVAKGDSYYYENGGLATPTPSATLAGGSPGRGERFRDDNVYGVYRLASN